MNLDFASYTRSAAFSLTLSENMMEAVLRIGEEQRVSGFGILHNQATSNALYRRGLIVQTAYDIPKEWKCSESEGLYCYDLTVAGQHVAALLKEAGFKVRVPIASSDPVAAKMAEIELKPQFRDEDASDD